MSHPRTGVLGFKKIRRSSWAGIKIQAKDRRFLIDAMLHAAPFKRSLGDLFWPPAAIAD
jgi:hypothetical protein